MLIFHRPKLALLFLALLLPGVALPAVAGTCVAGSSCGQAAVQFAPGTWISLEVVNRTQDLVNVQYVEAGDPQVLAPGQILTFARGVSSIPNMSLFFWNDQGLAIRAAIRQPDSRHLRIELTPQWQGAGQSAILLRNDGRVDVF